jgi:SAM-dependent methyltransferase
MAKSLSSLYPVHLTPGGPSLSRELLKACPREFTRREDAQLLLMGSRFGENAIALADVFAGRIVAIEDDSEAVLYARMAVSDAGVGARVSPLLMSPVATNFRPGQFDIILMEGVFSSYPPGKALKEASRILAKDGILLFSDSCWLETDIPIYARQVWESPDHKIMTIDAICTLLTERGFEVKDITDRSNVLNSFYEQFREAAQSLVRGKFEGMKHQKTLIKHYKHEIDVYHKHGGDRYMGYVSIAAVRGEVE